jgi:predicted nucleotidyltransferase
MVQLIELFDKYIRWRILAHFLSHPNTSFYIKEVARTLNVSPGSVSTALKFFEEWGLLIREEKERVHLYRLNQEHPLAYPLKRTYGLVLVLSSMPAEKFLEADGNIISIALFGSYADGSYDEESDIDILIIAPAKKEGIIEVVRGLEDELGKHVNVSLFKLSEWRLMAKRGDVFYKKVVQNHVMLYGSGLT